jgi:hypothetical protein
LPCFTSLLCLLWPAVCLVCVSSGCGFLSRGALSVSGVALGPARLRLPVGCWVSVSVGVGFLVPVAPFRPVWPFQGVEQVFDLLIRTRVSNKCSKVKVEAFLANLSEFSTESDRISTESSLSVEPNLNRISESLSLTFEPNPNRISKSSQDFILLVACSLGVRCRICELGLVDCWGLLVSSGQLGMGHLFSCLRCIGGSKGLSLGLAWHAFCSLLSTGLSLFFFLHAWLLAFAQSSSGESHSGMRLWSAFHNLGKVLRT